MVIRPAGQPKHFFGTASNPKLPDRSRCLGLRLGHQKQSLNLPSLFFFQVPFFSFLFIAQVSFELYRSFFSLVCPV